MAHLNSEHLRTFLGVQQANSVTGGAARIGRSQSATSLQIKLLEEVVGTPLFRRHGRGVVLTAAGERLLPVAKRITQSLDRTLADLRGDELRGKLRMGLCDHRSSAELSMLIADFCALYPDVELEVRYGLGTGFEAALEAGGLDLAIQEVAQPEENDEVLAEEELMWMVRRGCDLSRYEVLPIAVFDRACWWRDLALASLEDAGQPYRVVLTSESTAGVVAAVEAGIAAGMLSPSSRASELEALQHLTIRRRTYLVLRIAKKAPERIAAAMAAAIRKAFAV